MRLPKSSQSVIRLPGSHLYQLLFDEDIVINQAV